MPLELDGVASARRRPWRLTALDTLGVLPQAASFPDDLSGGERQRVRSHRPWSDRVDWYWRTSRPVHSTR